jgi:hypothetical protein
MSRQRREPALADDAIGAPGLVIPAAFVNERMRITHDSLIAIR